MLVKRFTGWLLVVLLTAIPIFGHLDQMPLIQWDEARTANNALEMYHNGNAIVTYYGGAPDMWNTKPPLLIWLQVICMHIVGVNELAVRLPSALAALATCLLLFWFLGRKINNPLLGIIAVLVLITSEGYVRYHVIRTGDYDSLLVFFMLAAGVFFYLFIEEEGHRTRRLYLFFGALTLSFLTKGIPALIFTPAMLLYAGWRGKLHLLLKNRHTYFGVLCFLLITGGYYLLREHYNPGYLKAVLYNDVTGRYLHTDGDNGNDASYYLRAMTEWRFKYWYLLIVPAIIVGVVQADDRLRRASVYAALLAVFHFAVISFAQTKNDWYDAAIYPFWAIIVAQLIWCFCMVLGNAAQGVLRKNVLPAALLLLVFTVPYERVLDVSLSPPRMPFSMEDEGMGIFLKRIYHHQTAKPDAALVWDSPNSNIVWYLQILKDTKRQIALADVTTLKPGNKVIAYQNGVKSYIGKHYASHIVDQVESAIIYRIDSVSR